MQLFLKQQLVSTVFTSIQPPLPPSASTEKGKLIDQCWLIITNSKVFQHEMCLLFSIYSCSIIVEIVLCRITSKVDKLVYFIHSWLAQRFSYLCMLIGAGLRFLFWNNVRFKTLVELIMGVFIDKGIAFSKFCLTWMPSKSLISSATKSSLWLQCLQKY